MKKQFLVYLCVLCFFRCGKEQPCYSGTDSDVCSSAKSNILNQTYSGNFTVCDGFSELEVHKGTATLNSLSADEISLHFMTTDTVLVDTTFVFTMECCVIDGNVPSVNLYHSDNTSVYYDGLNRLNFRMIYGSCGEFAWLEGN